MEPLINGHSLNKEFCPVTRCNVRPNHFICTSGCNEMQAKRYEPGLNEDIPAESTEACNCTKKETVPNNQNKFTMGGTESMTTELN